MNLTFKESVKLVLCLAGCAVISIAVWLFTIMWMSQPEARW
jgi:hypothetical protein